MTCIFGHDEYVISSEVLIKSPYYGFVFKRCRKCNKCKIDSESFKRDKKGKWKNHWTDDNGIMPQCSLPDKKCPKCGKIMKKTTAFGGEWSCEPDPSNLYAFSDENFHMETIKAKPEDYLEV